MGGEIEGNLNRNRIEQNKIEKIKIETLFKCNGQIGVGWMGIVGAKLFFEENRFGQVSQGHDEKK